MLDRKEVIKYYKSYGFNEEVSSHESLLIFTMQSGHFFNAELVVLNSVPSSVIQSKFDELVNSGFACQKKVYKNNENIWKNIIYF